MATSWSARRCSRWCFARSTLRSTPSSKPKPCVSARARSISSIRRRRPKPLRPTTESSAALGSCGSGRRSLDLEQVALPQCLDHVGEMGSCRSVEPFEPILIEERGERRLTELSLPEDPQQRGRGLVRLALQWRQNRGALGCVTIKCVGTGTQSKLDQPAPLGRGQYEMGDLVQNYVSLGSTIQCRSVPVEAARGSFRLDRHAKAARDGERREAVLLRLNSGGPVRQGRADSLKNVTGQPVGDAGHEAVEHFRELLAGYRCQDHLVGHEPGFRIIDGFGPRVRIAVPKKQRGGSSAASWD